MKKTRLFLVIAFSCVLVLTGCDSKCDCNCPSCQTDDQNVLGKAAQFCFDHGWTYSVIYYSETEIDWECSFPSWIGCNDDLLLDWTCDFEPNLSSIDTEEKRLLGCNDNVDGWITDFEDWDVINTDWESESEGGASFVRNGVVHYTKNWSNRKMSVECVADFVDWSISVSYSDWEPEMEL